MPERIIGKTDDIKVLPTLHIMIEPVTIHFIIAAIVKMDHHLYLLIPESCKKRLSRDLPHGPDAGTDKSGDIIIFRFPAIWPEQSVRKLISYLYHIR